MTATEADGGNNLMAILMTVSEVTQELRCGRTMLYQFIRQGRLPVVKMGKATRIRREDVLTLIDQLVDEAKSEA